MRARLAVILCVITLCAGCKKTAVYFVPIGDAPLSEINDLVVHYRYKLGLKSAVLPPMAVSPSDLDSNRQQLVAEKVLTSLQRDYARYLENDSAILIGITGEDMYPLGEDWRFCFGWRRPEIRMAVVSTARMNLFYPGEPIVAASLPTRLRKVVTKDIGVMYYHYEASSNPRSVLYSGILGIQELDQVTEDF